MNSFNTLAPLFSKVDTITMIFIHEVTTKAIVALTPIITLGLTISFIWYGIMVIRGNIDMPVQEFMARIFRISIITSIALAGGLYQTNIAEAIQTLPDELINALLINPTQEQNAAAAIDKAAQIGFSKASKAFQYSGFLKDNGILYALFGVIILIAVGVFISIGSAMILLTKLALAILVGIGPFFIFALLWKPTAEFFNKWLAQILNYILLSVLFTAVFGLMIDILGGYMDDIKFDGLENTGYLFGGIIILSITMIMILLQLPNIASGLAGGVSISYANELSRVKDMAQDKVDTAKQIYNAGKNILSHFPSVNSGGNITRDNIANAGKAAHGYFKGNLK